MNDKSSEVLALQVVCYRTLGIGKENSILAMQELSLRKQNGDTFDFNAYIESKIKEIPDSHAKINQQDLLKNIIQNVSSGIK